MIYIMISKAVFFPSDSMVIYCKFNNKVALPPAGEVKNRKNTNLNNTVIYVGGVSKEFGIDILVLCLEFE